MPDDRLGDPKEQGTPAWWMAKLEPKLNERLERIQLFQDYYDGHHRLAFATDEYRKAFGLLFKPFSDNWMALVVDAVEERLNIEGFRIPLELADLAPGDPDAVEELTTGDSDAWDMWQANNLDAESQLAHTDSLVDGVSYVLVGPGEDYPEITVESAQQIIVATAAGHPRNRLAALKKWRDDSGYLFATLYLPEVVVKLQSERPTRNELSAPARVNWVPREVPGENWPLPNPLGEVPVVALRNRPRVLVDGVSEIRDIIPIQDALNKEFMDMIVASEYAGFRQRWATGIEVPVDPETNQPIRDLYKMSLDRFITSPSENTTFGTLEASDLDNYVKAIELSVHHIASRTRTPPHYFYMAGFMPSGESLRAAETGLVAKVVRKQRFLGEGWEDVIRMGFKMAGKDDKSTAARSAEVIWADPEFRTESEHVDALLKQQALGIPDEILWEKAGYSPQEIERIKAIKLATPAPAPQVVITPMQMGADGKPMPTQAGPNDSGGAGSITSDGGGAQ